MTDEIYSIGQWIRHRRKTLDMTQQGLADRAHCSINTIKKIETDSRRPSRQLASLLAEQLDVPEEQYALFIDIARGVRPVESLLDKVSRISEARFAYDPQPVSSSKVIGRESELAALKLLIQDSRLVTITGPGGVGKSTLAQAVMADFQRRKERAVFVSLVGVSMADHISHVIAVELNLDIPPGSDPLEQILAYLKSKRILLVLDNFEHLLDGANILEQILNSSSEVRILTTTRERLRLDEEQVFPLQGLLYPENDADNGNLEKYPAAGLFVARARKLIPEFKPTDSTSLIKICQLTEGLPLALELAASWVNSLSLAEIVFEIQHNLDVLANDTGSDTFRHGSIRSVIETSWKRLSELEQEVFSSLSVFQGGYTRQAGEAVCGATREIVSVLVSHSMLKFDHESGRYSIHALLRIYGIDKLKDSGRFETIQKVHALFFLDLAETSITYLHGDEQNEWFDRLDEEQDNIRAALSFLLANEGQSKESVRLVVGLCWYWRIRSRVVEARYWVDEMLQVDTDDVNMLAVLHYHAGHFDWMQGDAESARKHQMASINFSEALGDTGVNIKSNAYLSLGMIANMEGDFIAAEKYFLESAQLFGQCGDDWGKAFSQKWLGVSYMEQRKFEDAKISFQKAESYFRKCGDRWALGLLLGFYAWMKFDNGKYDDALILAREALEIREEFGHKNSVIDMIDLISQVTLEQGNKKEARRLYQSAIEISEEVGNQRNVLIFKNKLAELAD